MRRLYDRAFIALSVAGAVLTFGVIATVAGLVIWRGAPAISISFLTEGTRAVGAAGGIAYQLIGTLILITTAAVIAIPIATGVGLFHALYRGSSRFAGWLESILYALNGIPSIVFGLFGLAVFVQSFGLQKSWLAGGAVLALMILPTLTIAFIEKLRAIPHAKIEASFGLGLRRSEVATSLLLPAGAPGLVTGTLLGMARAAGETAPIMFTAAIFAGATIPGGVRDSPVLALPYHIFVLAQDSLEPGAAQNMWGSAMVLLLLVSALSAMALPFRMKLHEEARRD